METLKTAALLGLMALLWVLGEALILLVFMLLLVAALWPLWLALAALKYLWGL